MEITKNKGILTFDKGNGLSATFSLIDGSMTRIKNGKETVAKSLANFFYGYDISIFNTYDEKFVDFISLVSRKYSTCRSINTFLERSKNISNLESWTAIGYDSKLISSNYICSKRVSDFPKDIINIFKNIKCNIDSTIDVLIDGNSKELFSIIRYLYEMEEYEILQDVINRKRRYYYSNSTLITEIVEIKIKYNLNMKSIVNYISYIYNTEISDIHKLLSMYSDYLDMSTKMARKNKDFELYPKYLKSKHDIITKHYNLYKIEYNEEMFYNMYLNKKLEYSDGKYSVIKPKNTNEVKMEGQDLGHCVKSYIEKVIDGKCLILFMRNSKELDKSLVTIEVKNKDGKYYVNQKAGLHNRSTIEVENTFINKFIKHINKEEK